MVAGCCSPHGGCISLHREIRIPNSGYESDTVAVTSCTNSAPSHIVAVVAHLAAVTAHASSVSSHMNPFNPAVNTHEKVEAFLLLY